MTPEEGLRKQIEIYRGMTGQQRLQIAFDLYEMTRVLVRAGVRHQHPDWDEQQVEQEMLRSSTRDFLANEHSLRLRIAVSNRREGLSVLRVEIRLLRWIESLEDVVGRSDGCSFL